MSEIRGNTSQIKSTASSIRQDTASYGTAMQTLFDAVESLSSTFISEDGTAYIQKIKSFRPAFESMQKKLDASAVALEEIAQGYEQTIKANKV